MKRRRGVRIDGRFWVRLVGLDDEPELRNGNISVTGVYIETDRRIGRPGAVETLELLTEDRSHRVVTPVALVREVSVDDLWSGGARHGLAFEFLCEEAATRDRISAMVRAVAHRYLDGEGTDLDGRDLAAEVSIGERHSEVSIARVGHDALVLETGWPVEDGAEVRIEIRPPRSEAPVEIQGVARSTSEDGETWRIEISPPPTRAVGPAPLGSSLHAALDSLMDEMVAPPVSSAPTPHVPHLMGSLSRVALPTLLSLLEVERLTGILTLRQPGGESTLFLEDGHLLDLLAPHLQGDPRDRLMKVLAVEEGEFELSVEPVDRRDVFDAPIRALVLDAVRRLDE